MAKTKSKRAAARQVDKVRQAHATTFEEHVIQRPTPQVRRAVKRRTQKTGLAYFVSEFPVLSGAIGLALIGLLFLVGRNYAETNHLGPYALKPNSCAWATDPATFKITGAAIRKYSAEPQQCVTVATLGSYTATIKTPKGNMIMYLDQTKAPHATNNFIFLATHKFYDGLTWHRVVANFVVQAGDPRSNDPKADTTTGATNGEDGPGYTFNDILPKSVAVFTPGAVAMANPGKPAQSGSQFFITIADDTKTLTNNYIFFARITPDDVNNVAVKLVQGDPIQSITIAYDPKSTPGALPAAATATPTK